MVEAGGSLTGVTHVVSAVAPKAFSAAAAVVLSIPVAAGVRPAKTAVVIFVIGEWALAASADVLSFLVVSSSAMELGSEVAEWVMLGLSLTRGL